MGPLPACARAALLAVLAVGPASAQGVPWRKDYAAACREAREQQKPLLLDLGTANCSWCVKLDASTFRDPAVVRLLSDGYIPVKIDAERDPRLAQGLNVQSYPTLIIATPDGRVVHRQEGYVEAAALAKQLARFRGEPAGPGQPTVRLTAPPAPPLAEP